MRLYVHGPSPHPAPQHQMLPSTEKHFLWPGLVLTDCHRLLCDRGASPDEGSSWMPAALVLLLPAGVPVTTKPAELVAPCKLPKTLPFTCTLLLTSLQNYYRAVPPQSHQDYGADPPGNYPKAHEK